MTNIDLEKKCLREYCEHLKELLKEDILNLACEPKTPVIKRQHIAVVPLPQEINIEEVVELLEDSYYVTFNIRCGLRFFSTKCFIGDTPDGDKITQELKRCVASAIEQCLKWDKGELREVTETGTVINLQSL